MNMLFLIFHSFLSAGFIVESEDAINGQEL